MRPTLIGKALKELGVDCKRVFITSKLKPTDQGKDRAPKAIEASLKALGTDYLDLYLIHWPGAGGLRPEDEENAVLRRESWDVLVQYQKKGVLKSIGVSNYLVPHLKDLMEHSSVKPQVNQMEFHPFYQHGEVLNFCREHGIHVTAYSSLGMTAEAGEENVVLTSPEVLKAAKACGEDVTPAQLLLRWPLEKGYSIVPKSTNAKHIAENARVMDFKITEAAIKILDGLGKRNNKLAWDPEVIA